MILIFLAIFFKIGTPCPNKAIVYNLIHIFIYYQILYVLIECIHLKFMYCIYNDLMSHRITNPLKHSRSQNMLFVKKKIERRKPSVNTYPLPLPNPSPVTDFRIFDVGLNIIQGLFCILGFISFQFRGGYMYTFADLVFRRGRGPKDNFVCQGGGGGGPTPTFSM